MMKTTQPQLETIAQAPPSATGFVGDLEAMTLVGNDYRRVLYTATHSQLVVMSLPPKEELGEEVHEIDQFFRFERGEGRVVLDGRSFDVRDGFAVLIPAGSRHNVINTGTVPLKLYTLYCPPNHRDGVVHRTRADAEDDFETWEPAS